MGANLINEPQIHRETQTFLSAIVAKGGIVTGAGKTFYVDPNHDNANDNGAGDLPDEPFATMQAAVNACVDDRGDKIVRGPGTETVSTPVQFNKSGIIVVASDLGLPSEVQGEKFMTYNNQSDGLSAAVITAPCALVGLGFAASDVSEEALLIDCEEQGGFNGGFNLIHSCRFPAWNGAIDAAIRTIGGALNHIVDCEFDGLFSGFGGAVIQMEGDTGGITPFYPRVKGCRFMGIGSNPAIFHETAAVEAVYTENVMGAEGTFLDENSLASTGIVYNNWLGGANQAAMFSNIGSTNLKIVGNHYNE